MRRNKLFCTVIVICTLLISLLSACVPMPSASPAITLDNIPPFASSPYVAINNNQPYFEQSEITAVSFEYYSELDELGRCGVAFASIGIDLMPDEPRGNIGQIKPSGWQSVKYDFVDGKYLYNRCHLIGFQLTGENANEKNLITGTRYMNTKGMLPFENMVADYIKETNNHVMYRVTPMYNENELVARGVLIEALSVEDNGDGICFNVYVYNNQPDVIINYADGTSRIEGTAATPVPTQTKTYILNTNTLKFHSEECKLAHNISEQNKERYNGSRDDLIKQGYSPCKTCNP